MVYRIRRHVEVEQYILELALWIAKDSREVATRFFEAVEEAVFSLRTIPGRGSPKELQSPRLANVRSWAVRGFPNHLILYEIRGEDVFVLAIVHGAREYSGLLRGRTSE